MVYLALASKKFINNIAYSLGVLISNMIEIKQEKTEVVCFGIEADHPDLPIIYNVNYGNTELELFPMD